MELYNKLKNKKEKISIIGLGYVGLPLALSFSKYLDVVGFDINKAKIENYKKGIDITNEADASSLINSKILFTSNEDDLQSCKFHIIVVPTPTKCDNTPDLSPLIEATKTVARNLTKGSVIVYESTVYPGVTEDICIPIIENESRLKCGIDFKVGYSPERINPGDKIHTLENTVKIVSGIDNASLNMISKVYELIIEAGIYKAESIKIAEAAKVIENSQRDVNIAFFNEMSILFNKLNIDTSSVIKAASTKWNFINLTPGLVGGHCIGVDPYYLIHKGKILDIDLNLLNAARSINNNMSKFIVESTIKCLIKANKKVNGCRIAILGLTFKENCSDIRNSKVFDIIEGLKEYGIEVIVSDPLADSTYLKSNYNINLINIEEIQDIDGIILAVPHLHFKDISISNIYKMFKVYNQTPSYTEHEYIEKNVIIDIKSMLNKTLIDFNNFIYWSL
ncbi:MAG: nucleotide sugar dehydrogenase [Clostridium sp.]|nr:nucleotide sugar dehydrogenase [Clostridium sp.]